MGNRTSLSTGNSPLRLPIPDRKPGKGILWLLLIFMVVEYGRPLFIAELKIQLFIIVVFAFVLLGNLKQISDRVITAQLLFLLVLSSSMLWAVNSFSVYATARVMFGIVVISAAIAWVTQYLDYAMIFMRLWLAVLCYCAIYGVTHGGVGPGGFVGDENDLALACTVGLSFSIFGMIKESGRSRAIYAVVSGLLLAGIVVSLSRGGFLAAFAVVGYAIMTSRGIARKMIWPAIAVILFLVFAPAEYKEEVFSIAGEAQATEDEFSTALQRKFLWATATNMFVENPLLGVGASNFPWNVGEYQPVSGNWPAGFFEQSRAGTAVHSTYFELLSETAFYGVTICLFILFHNFTRLRKLRRWSNRIENRNEAKHIAILANGLTGALIGYLVGAVFLSTLYYPHLWYLSAFVAGLHVLSNRESDPIHMRKQER